MPNPLSVAAFVSPGDFFLDFCLGQKWAAVNREKVANDFGMGPKPIGLPGTMPYTAQMQPLGTTGPDVQIGEYLFNDPKSVPPGTLDSINGFDRRTGVSTRNLMLPSQPPADFSAPKPAVLGNVGAEPKTGPIEGFDAGGDRPPVPSILEQYGTPLAIGAGALGLGLAGGAGLAYYRHQQEKKKREQEAALMGTATPGGGLEAEKMASVPYGHPDYAGPLPPLRTPRESIRDKVLAATGLKAETDLVARGFPVERLIADHELSAGDGPSSVPPDEAMYGHPAAATIDAIHARRKAWEDAHEKRFRDYQAAGVLPKAAFARLVKAAQDPVPTVQPIPTWNADHALAKGWNNLAGGANNHVSNVVGQARTEGTPSLSDFAAKNPWLPGLGIGAAAGAGLTALGGIGSKRKKKDRFGDIAVGGLLGAGVGGLAGGLWGSNLFGGGAKPPETPPAGGSPPPSGDLKPDDLVGGAAPNLGGIVPQTNFGSPKQIVNNLAAGATRTSSQLRTLNEGVIPTVQRAQQLRDQAQAIGNVGAQTDLSDAVDRFAQQRGTTGQAGAAAYDLHDILDRYQTGQNLPPGRNPLNVAPDNSAFYSAGTPAPEKPLAAALGGAAAVGGEAARVAARDNRTNALAAAVGGAPVGARTAFQDAVDESVSPGVVNSDAVTKPRAEFQRILQEVGGDKNKLEAGTETDRPVGFHNSNLGRTFLQGTGLTMGARALAKRVIHGDATSASAGRIADIISGKYTKPPKVPVDTRNPIAAAPGYLWRGAAGVANQTLNPTRGVMDPHFLPTDLRGAANNAALVDRLTHAANARPGAAPVSRTDILASLNGSGPIDHAQLGEIAKSVQRGHGRGPALTPRALPRSIVGGTFNLGKNLLGEAYRSAPGGVLMSLWRNSGERPSYTTPAEDLGFNFGGVGPAISEGVGNIPGDLQRAGGRAVGALRGVDNAVGDMGVRRIMDRLTGKAPVLGAGSNQSVPAEAQAAVDRELSTRANRESEGRVADMYRRGVMPNPPPGAMTFDQFVETFPPMQRAQQSGAMQSLYLQYLQQQRGGR